MKKTLTINDLPPRYRAQAEAQLLDYVDDKIKRDNDKIARNKYNAIATADATGHVHPSRLQADVTHRLREAARAVICEVSMPLSSRKNDRIRIDALQVIEINEDGTFVGRFVEAKSRDLDAGKQRRRRFEDAYGLQILVIKREDLK